MAIRIGINGFGRIGRHVFKIAFEKEDIEICAINDITDAKTLAHLLKYDSIYGRYSHSVEVDGDNIVIDGKKIKISSERDPKNLPWKEMKVDIVIESTGVFTKKEQVMWHVEAGAKKVILTVPAKDKVDNTIVLGVNDEMLKKEDIVISNASCTTNCLAPLVKVLHDNFGVIEGLMTTIHSYTNDQRILDLPHKDLRRARAAALSIIPTTTGAARAVGLVIPDLKGKLNGLAIRVPTPTGSLVDLTAKLKKDASTEDINAAVKTAAAGPMKGILKYCDEPIVSADVIKDTHSSIFDALSTMKLETGLVKVLSWYDNEWGYSCRVVDLIALIAKKGL
ncbi:MAG: type I glyceraldehyde-3-phosphate dehydrogenase [Candidatus Omnitrophica bacterium]|nr:type I glyceraldehyde-3-phosphate dehydrogenase [Candidatus Omnitrophota bacterium]MBU1925658.1 type I glyceraldehyde-3-phosphate dehydrogenase [Candidatus Omnitrophota bacterium]MBU2063946.1 type I glyceraldehyde-3-phosphate dehydrogenase [Candidatus Omnitrophota bacterium]